MIDLGGPLPHFTLGVVSRLLAADGIVRSAVRSIFPSQDAKWLEGMLPNELAPIIELRNPAATASRCRWPRWRVCARRSWESVGRG